MFDPMNVVEGFDFSNKTHAEVWDDGDVVVNTGKTDIYGYIYIHIPFNELEKLVEQARIWMDKREEMKNQGTQP